MERSSTHVALLLALIVCCSMASSAAAARAFVDGNREGERPPAPWASGRSGAAIIGVAQKWTHQPLCLLRQPTGKLVCPSDYIEAFKPWESWLLYSYAAPCHAQLPYKFIRRDTVRDRALRRHMQRHARVRHAAAAPTLHRRHLQRRTARPSSRLFQCHRCDGQSYALGKFTVFGARVK
ncbi:hypothetical protein VPH35_057191 [Triticum aestivum]